MANPSGRKGRDAEKEVARYLREDCGIEGAERDGRRKGAADTGDIEGWPGVTIEVKNRKSSAVPTWLNELLKEMRNADTTIGLLVVKVAGKGNAGDWRWWVVRRERENLLGPEETTTTGPHSAIVAVDIVKKAGW